LKYSFDELKNLFKNDKKYTFKQLVSIFNLASNEEKVQMLTDLTTLEETGVIVNIEDNYFLFPKNKYILTNVKLFQEIGYFYYKDTKYTIHPSNLNSCLNNDLCLVLFDEEEKNAKIKKIVKRNNNLLVCEKINNEIKIYGRYSDLQIKISNIDHIENNTRFLVKINNNNLEGKFIETIGYINEPDIDLKTIALSKGFEIEFSKECIDEVNKINGEITEKDLVNRLDLRDKLIYTIDCDNTKDMDDAVSVEINEAGNFIIGVHIADLSHYVNFESEIFKEAYKRGTSVYLIDSVIPMIDKKLSNDICSLNPNVDRLTVSCIMEMNEYGEILDYKICKSVINSKKKMKYSEVNKILENNTIVSGYEDFVNNLKLLQKVNKILTNSKKKKGKIEFDDGDLQVLTDPYGKPLDFVINKQKSAEMIIENLMILANEVIANHYSWCPFIYRVHDIPDNEKIKEILEFLRVVGYKIPNVKNFENPKVIQGLLENLKDNENFRIISNNILRGMQRAIYSPHNLGHFGLAIENYTHFTSPIRRLSDLIVHILISSYNNPEFFEDLNIDNLEKFLIDASMQASIKERNADAAEIEANLMKMAEYMEKHIGEYYNGVITNITPSIINVETNNILGKVLFSDIKNDFYQFNPNNYTMVGKSNKNILKIGDYVRLKVLDASKANRTINFQIVEKINKKDKVKELKY